VIALVVGTALAIGALAFVLAPLFREEWSGEPAEPAPPRLGGGDADREGAIDALREIEFDRETGKLSDADYAELKALYTTRALAAMRAGDDAAAGALAAPSLDDEIEARVRRHRAATRVCPSCGPRPEPDAVYCSSCGRYLAGSCTRCGAAVTEPGAQFCTGCGGRIGAMTIARTAVA
jgi:hypothetical protein